MSYCSAECNECHSYNTCHRCKQTDEYCKWYKTNLTTCKICEELLCKECIGDHVDSRFVEYCSKPYAVYKYESLCSQCAHNSYLLNM